MALTVPGGPGSNVTLYLNGSQVNSTQLTGTGVSYSAAAGYSALLGANFTTVVVGGSSSILTPGTSYAFPCSFADVQLYGSTLSAAQVTAIAGGTTGGGCAPFILAPPPPPSPPPAAVYLVSGPTCNGAGNSTTVSATFAGASTTSGTVQAVDYNAAAFLLAGKATGVSAQTCAFTATSNQFTCTGLSLTMGETCTAASGPPSGSLGLLSSNNPSTLCSTTSNLANFTYTYVAGTFPCPNGPGTCSSQHSTYTTSAALQTPVVNPYDLATASNALSIRTGQFTYLNMSLPGGGMSFTAGAVGTSASGTCVVNGTDSVICYGAQIPAGYGCSVMGGGGGMPSSFGLMQCSQVATGTVSPAGVCAFCPAGQIPGNSSLTSCVAGTSAPLTPPAQCGGVQHRWVPAAGLSTVTSASVSDVVGGATLQFSGVSAGGALQMQGATGSSFSGNPSGQNATYAGASSLLGMSPASGLTLVRAPLPALLHSLPHRACV